MLKGVLKLFSENKIAVIIIALGTLSWLPVMFKSGLSTEWGIGFWGANGHDGIWHLALSNSLSRGLLEVPTMSGLQLQNYHIGFDFLLSLLSKTGISSSYWYFQILPIVFALSIGVLTYCFVYKWKKDKSAASWSTFFMYFGGSLGWIVTLVRGQGFGGESMFWSQQSISTLINPPYALSLVMLLLLLNLLLLFFQNNSYKSLFLVTLILGTLIEIKAYAGVLALTALSLLWLVSFLKERRKSYNVLILVIILSSICFIFFLRFLVPTVGNVFELQPGWFLETMLSISDRFYWIKLYEALLAWKSGHVYFKATAGYATAFVLFIIGNIGSRIVAVLYKRSWDYIDVFLSSILVFGIVAPTFFVQKGTAWNTIQFFYYSLFVLNIYAGISISRVISNKSRMIMGVVIFLVTIPTSVSTLASVYIPSRPPAVLPYDEYEALNYLATRPEGVVLTYPFDPIKAREAEHTPPRPLYLYDSTAYVSAFSNKSVFLEDEVNLTILGYNWPERQSNVLNFYKALNPTEAKIFLKDNKIRYIYWIKPQRATLGETQLNIKQIFENKSVVIYEFESETL